MPKNKLKSNISNFFTSLSFLLACYNKVKRPNAVAKVACFNRASKLMSANLLNSVVVINPVTLGVLF